MTSHWSAFASQLLPWNTRSSKYYGCVSILALGIRHANRIFCAILRCRLWPVWLFTVFYSYILSHKRLYFRKKKLFKINCSFWFSTQLLSKPFLILRRIRRDMAINVYWSSCKAPLNYLDRYSKKSSNIKFLENPYSGSRASCGQTDRRTDSHDEGKRRFSQLCERVGKFILFTLS